MRRRTSTSGLRPAQRDILLRIARATATLDLDVLLERAVLMSARALSAGRAAIYVVSSDGRWLELAAATRAKSRSGRWPIQSIGHFTAQVLRTGRSVRVDDFRAHPLRSPETEAGLAFVSFVAVPLDAGCERLGCLQVGEPSRLRRFTAREVAFLRGIADQLALAIRNARLAKERAENLEALRRVSRRLLTVQEDERKRIARELHDEAGQALTAIRLGLAGLRQEVPPALVVRVDEVSALAQDVLGQLRRIAQELRPAALDELGLLPSLRALVDGFQQRTGLCLAVDFDPRVELGGEAANTVYRFVQEALTNVARHASASRVSVHAVKDASRRVAVRVVDDGVGFDPDRRAAGLGLEGMRERARLLGGSVRIESSLGCGTSVTLALLRTG